eukprot:TRINITY_DN364_c0_g1_i2.p1 TRINITY_DN364_c0_g1~~TRINITY_DN364_c0_g1_i2.p1  ORF type:complete len:795 (-),score=210.54 TRINITY_DN364_c0_g1_i2:151-2535(-)
MSVLKLAPNFGQKSEVLFKLAVIFGKTYQLDQAINYFKLAMLESTGAAGTNRRIDIHTKMGICYLEKKEYGEALKAFELALSLNEQNFHTYQHIAWCEFLMEKYTQALEHISKAVALKDSDGDSYYIKGRILLATDKHSEAKEVFNRAISLDQTKAVYVGSLGILNCILKLNTEAFDNFLKATQIDSRIPETWFNIGLLYEMHEQYSEAGVAYQKAMEVAPDFTPAATRRELVNNAAAAKIPLPQFIHPEFRVSDSMVPLRSFLNNQKIKKALEPSIMQTGQPATIIRNIFNDASLPPPEDDLKLAPPAIRVNEDDKDSHAEAKAREDKKQAAKEKKKEPEQEHVEVPLPPTPQPREEPKQEAKVESRGSLERSKPEHYTQKAPQPVAMVTPQPTYPTVPKVIRPAPAPAATQPLVSAQPTAPAPGPPMHAQSSAPPQIPMPQQPPVNQFDMTPQMQYGSSLSMSSIQQVPQLAQLMQMAMPQMQTAQTMSQSQIPQGQPMSQMPSSGFPPSSHPMSAQYMNLVNMLAQISQQPQLQSQLQGLLNYFGMMAQQPNMYTMPSYQNYMAPPKPAYTPNMPMSSSAPPISRPMQPVQQEIPQYQFSNMPRVPMPSPYSMSNFPSMHRPEPPAPSLPMNLPRPSYPANDQAHMYAMQHQEQPQVPLHSQEISNPPVIPTRPIPQHPRVVPGLRPPTVRQPIRMPGRHGLDDLLKVVGADNRGVRPPSFQRTSQEYYGQEYDNKREECGNVVKLSMSPQKLEEEFYAKRRKSEQEMNRDGMGGYDQQNAAKRYKGDQNE